MKHEDVPTLLPFDAWIDGDNGAERVVVLEYGTYAGATNPTFLCRDANGNLYRTSVESYELSAAAIEKRMSAEMLESVIGLTQSIAALQAEIAAIKAHRLYPK